MPSQSSAAGAVLEGDNLVRAPLWVSYLWRCFSRSITDTKIQKKRHGPVPRGKLSVGRLLLAVHRLVLRLGQPLGSPNVTASHRCSVSVRS